MPVDTTQSFVLIESAGATCEGMVMESRLIEVKQLALFVRSERQALQRFLQKRSIAEVGIEMHLAFAVAGEESGIEQSLHKGQRGLLRRKGVLLEERGQRTVGIEHVTALVLAIERRGTHSVQQVSRLSRREIARREDSHLPLQHLVKVGNSEGLRAFKADEVIRMVEPVGATVGGDGAVEERKGTRQEEAYMLRLQFHLLAREARVCGSAICLACHACRVGVLTAGVVVQRSGRLQILLGGLQNSVEELYDLAGDGVGGVHAVKQALQEDHEAPHVAERYHGRTVADERIVRVVPLGAERVHPYARVGHKVAQFGQQGDKQFLGHGNQQGLLGLSHHETRVLSVLGQEGEDMLVQVIVEADGVLGVCHYLGIRLEAVRHIGEGKLAHARHVAQRLRVVRKTEFEQAAEVDNLVVAPVADVRPRVLGLYHLPVYALGGNLIGVVAVNGSGVEKLRDDTVRIERVRQGERLPVLEDVAPVALISNDTLAFGVIDTDVKQVPRARRVAVAAGEGQRQILQEEAMELAILTVQHALLQRRVVHLLGQLRQESAVAFCQSTVEVSDMAGKGAGVDAVVVAIEPAAHGVEEGVGEVACHARLVGGLLYAVVLPYNSPQVVGGLLHGFLYLFYGVGLREALHTRPDLGSVERHIAYLVPCPLAVGVEGERTMRQCCTANALALGLVGNRLLHTERIQLAGRSQQTRLRQAEREDRIATQRLAGLSAVHQDSLHAEERSEGESLGLLIRIHQRREDILRLLFYARRQHILQAVYHLHGHRLRAVVAQAGAAHPSPLPCGHPLVAKSQPEVKVLLHEEQAVADHRLGDRAFRPIHAHIAVRERLPREY